MADADAAGSPADAASGLDSLAESAVLRPLRTGNAFEDTVERLLQTVRLGIVAPGEALPAERDLAARFEVSRDTLREAIRSLAEAGYLVSRRGRYGGTFVVDVLPPAADTVAPTAAELDDALGLREILEVGAARAAASRDLSAGERSLLWKRLGESAAASLDDHRRLDSRLHLTIGELAGLPSLVELLAENRMRVNGYLDGIPFLIPNLEHSNHQHEAVVAAILTGDADAAAAAMSEHLRGTAALLRGFLR